MLRWLSLKTVDCSGQICSIQKGVMFFSHKELEESSPGRNTNLILPFPPHNIRPKSHTQAHHWIHIQWTWRTILKGKLPQNSLLTFLKCNLTEMEEQSLTAFSLLATYSLWEYQKLLWRATKKQVLEKRKSATIKTLIELYCVRLHKMTSVLCCNRKILNHGRKKS